MKLNVAAVLYLSASCAQSFSISSSKKSWRNSNTAELSRKSESTRSGLQLSAVSVATVATSRRQRGQRQQRTILPESTSASYEKSLEDASTLIQLSEKGTVNASEEAEAILSILEESGHDVLNAVHYSSVINSWANAGDGQRALTVLNHMINRYMEAGQVDESSNDASIIIPNAHCFSSAMKGLKSSTSTPTSANRNKNQSGNGNGSLVSEKCEELLDKMDEIYMATGQEDARPNTVVYNNLLNSYAEDVTTLYLKRKMDDRKRLYPSVLFKQQPKDNNNEPLITLVDKAIVLLQEMERNPDIPLPDVYSYCTVISILAKCENLEMAKLGEKYLQKVSKKYDTPTYNALISAYASTGTREGAERASALLEELEAAMNEKRAFTKLSKFFGPNAVSYHSAISAWVKTCSVGDDGSAVEKAETILHRMEEQLSNSQLSEEDKRHRFQPNVIAYSSIIDCWSKSGSKEAADHARRLLDRMEKIGIKPNVVTFTSVLTSFARQNSVEGAKNAMNLLERMKKLYQDDNDMDVKPNIVSYFAVIDSWCRSNAKDAGTQAEMLLKELEELYRKGDKSMKPDVRVYARVIAAYAKTGRFKEAIMLLKKMEKYALTGKETYALAKPNVVCYNTLITSLGQRGKAKSAFNILNQMDQFSSSVEDESDKVIADERSLNGVIHALSTSNMKGKARKSLKILERLENSHIDGNWRSKASARSYNMVINACSNSIMADENERKQALNIAFDVFTRIRSSLHVDTDRYTYISMLKTCGKLIPKNSLADRKLAVKFVFESCCEEGLVDEQILTNFCMAAPKDLATAILGKHKSNPTLIDLPREWTHRAKRV